MTKLNQPQSSSNKGILNFKNGALTIGLAVAMLFSSCGKKTEQKLNDHDKQFDQAEQVDSIQTVRLSEHTAILEAIALKLNEHGIEIERLDTLTNAQQKEIIELYNNDNEFQSNIEELNKVIGKCCDATEETAEKTPVAKKPVKKVVKTPTIPSDTTKTKNDWNRKPSKNDEDGSGWFEL